MVRMKHKEPEEEKMFGHLKSHFEFDQSIVIVRKEKNLKVGW
jgi:hypothetical protein